jgi:hypothetical protein
MESSLFDTNYQPLIAHDGRPEFEMSREWCMPSRHTFEMTPVLSLLHKWAIGRGVIVDPFCGRSVVGTHRNDLSVGMDAEDFAVSLRDKGVTADVILFDPPYSPRQISEVYKSCGLKVGMKETQNASLYKRVRDALQPLSKVGTIALSFGWNSAGFGQKRGWAQREILLVAHGGGHNDTICVVEERIK